jgi:hypothetical protein
VFTTTLTLEERIARAQTQLAKAKENRRKAYEKAAKAEGVKIRRFRLIAHLVSSFRHKCAKATRVGSGLENLRLVT